MFLNPRYDDDPEFADKDGLKCSKWLILRYIEEKLRKEK